MPHEEARAEAFRRVERGLLGLCGRVRGEHGVRLPLCNECAQPATIGDLHAAPAAEGVFELRIVRVHRHLLHGEARRVVRTAGQFAARRLQFPGKGVEHRMPAPREFAAELDLKRMAGVVVNEEAHGGGNPVERGQTPIRRKRESRTRFFWQSAPRLGGV